ncbi:MAG: nucleoside 2-deoxyribosyltransferase [Candidatus Heimdallarchaeota archaeon]|nr:nucleoside 2-deoxyribosyltransferase [Candidatus Heimdallarchaeota archaeon]
MKVYLSGAIRGGRQLQNIYQIILDFLQEDDHDVLTYHVAKKNILEIETNQKDTEIFIQDLLWLEECDCVIAEVSVPSLGVGYEIAYTLTRKKPVLAIYDSQLGPISAMISGNNSSFISVFSYSSIPQLLEHLSSFFKKIQ